MPRISPQPLPQPYIVRSLLLGLLLAGLALLGACGSDGSKDPTPTPDVNEDTAADTDEPQDTDPDTDTEVNVDVPDACDVNDTCDPVEPQTPEEWIQSVPETAAWTLPGLRGRAYVVRVEGSIPHIYAENRHDLALVQGFVVARDRYFVMDLGRRLGLGELTPLLGDVALESDQESRGSGMRYVAERILEHLTPEQEEILDAFAAGINAYIEAVRTGDAPQPSELRAARTLLGASRVVDLMQPFSRRDLTGFAAVIVYNLGYETGDVGRARNVARMAGHFNGARFEEERTRGLLEDIWPRIAPVKPIFSADGWGTEGQSAPAPAAMRLAAPVRLPQGTRVPTAVLERLDERNERLQRRLNRDAEAGYGSNVWAVQGTHSTEGTSLLAGDGHLQLSVPSLFYQIGFDTSALGGDDFRQVGLIFPGLPFLAVGTNGHVAWSQTQLSGDITDWYEERLLLDEEGLPTHSWFDGEWRPLVRIDEVYEVASVPALGSEGRSEVWPRWQTFDGRWIAEIEGRRASPGQALEEGETLVNLRGTYVVPGDLDGDGVITGVSFAYAGFHVAALLTALEGFGTARDVFEFREWTRYLIAYSQNIIATDTAGNIFYTSYQAVPCRSYLERNEDRTWAGGADPALLLDGTRYGNFTIPTLADGRVDESHAEDPYRCVVPFDVMPQAINPERGFLQNANQDPGGITFSGRITDQPWYIGGPWLEGYRADTIHHALERAIADNRASAQEMQTIQANVDSRLGEDFVTFLIESIEEAGALARSERVLLEGSSEERIVALYNLQEERFEEVRTRMERWQTLGLIARSGVETFYQSPSAADREQAVATMIFNAWFGALPRLAIEDERMPSVWQGSGATGRIYLLLQMIAGRGPDNPLDLASWNAETQESAFWDILSTEVVESSTEVALLALQDALTFLASAPNGDEGGFGTDDMDAWLWGLRHVVRFESLLAGFLGDQPGLSILTDQFSINARRVRVMPGLPQGDPRGALQWFPRDGDQFAVDAANPGLSGTRFSYGSGPVFRMVIELGEGVVRGWNILPGGQSGLTNSPYFDDQVRLWLANETWPMRFALEEVIAGATARETFSP